MAFHRMEETDYQKVENRVPLFLYKYVHITYHSLLPNLYEV